MAAALLLSVILPPVGAQGAELLIDADQGIVLHAQDATRRMHPASLTKLMTVYLTFQAVAAGKLDLQQTLLVSDESGSQPPTSISLSPGDKITVEQAISATLLQSANDAAVVLAEAVAGNEDNFAARMTEQAHRLGMNQTQFFNATGLPDDRQVTSARDMAILALAIRRDFPQFGDWFSRRGFSYAGRSYGNINGILSAFDGADGMKTGFTCASGYNLVASAKRNGHRVIAVIMGASSREARLNRAVMLLRQGFAETEGPSGVIQLASLTDDPAPPPSVLSGGDCSATASREYDTGVVTGGGSGSWGVILGSFPKPATARQRIDMARKAAGGALGGQVQVIKRARDGVKLYAALVVGMGQKQATKACQTLRQKKIYCLALSPSALRSQRSPWQ